jgi:hypothetical protein
MNDQRNSPLAALGIVNEAALGNQLWKAHQEWLFDNDPQTSEEALHNEADLGRTVNSVLLTWMDQVLSREGVSKRGQEVVMALAPTLQMQRGNAA